jgi:hypothetical protein
MISPLIIGFFLDDSSMSLIASRKNTVLFRKVQEKVQVLISGASVRPEASKSRKATALKQKPKS